MLLPVWLHSDFSIKTWQWILGLFSVPLQCQWPSNSGLSYGDVLRKKPQRQDHQEALGTSLERPNWFPDITDSSFWFLMCSGKKRHKPTSWYLLFFWIFPSFPCLCADVIVLDFKLWKGPPNLLNISCVTLILLLQLLENNPKNNVAAPKACTSWRWKLRQALSSLQDGLLLVMMAKQSGSHTIEFQLRVWYSRHFYCPGTIFMIRELKPQSHKPSQSWVSPTELSLCIRWPVSRPGG